MTQPNHHRIERQVIELTVGGHDLDPSWQERFSRSFWARAVPELASVFDAAASPFELLRLDRLEIDLGMVSGADWEPEFRRRLVSEFSRRLDELRLDRKFAGATPVEGESIQGSLQQFLFFLKEGRLPWWGKRPDAGWSEAVAILRAGAAWKSLRSTLRDDEYACSRLVSVLSDELLEAAIAAWSGLKQATSVIERLMPTAGGAEWRLRSRSRLWTELVQWSVTGSADAVAGEVLMRRLLDTREELAIAEPDRATGGASSVDRDGERSGADFDTGNLPQPWQEWLSATLRSRAADSVADPATGSATAQAKSPAGRSPGKRREQLRSLEESPIYLQGAGAVLLHPFLKELFRDRGLLERDRFRDDSSRQRAVRLVAWLAFGRDDVPEQDLPIAKLLCGLDIEEPLEPVVLADDDVAACEALLQAVLTHWKALRSSSVNWLRSQFLLRDGKLEAVDEGWRLTVERRAQDVLLARLPWGFGVIELPMNQKRLFVRWLD